MTVLQEPEPVAAVGLSAIERIRNAALKSFATHGSAGTSLRTVAAAAGVSLGLVQHHFATKAGLIQAVDNYVLAQLLTPISQPIPEQTDSVGEMSDRITRLLAEQTDIADYIARALIDGSPLGVSIFDALFGFGTARWNQRGERGESRPDVDLTWAVVNSLVLALGTIVLRAHIERNLPEPMTSPAQLQRWHASTTMLLREGLFRRPD
jgi:AcrR family transcriptional regulator